MHILVTAGPTREFIDRVRFISNPSTGKMGYEIARAAKRRGHRVTLISGPTHLSPPTGVRTIQVQNADEMKRVVFKAFPKVNSVVMTAAVSDFKPRKRHTGKIKKNRKRNLTLRLTRTIDILETLGRRKGGRILVGFALETGKFINNAREKLLRKNLDFIIWTSPETFAADCGQFGILARNGDLKVMNLTKRALATRIVRLVERHHEQS